ncbi:MAG: hypothetical protein A2539_02615 [Elusimicrobia bacterium RIFOXYD2_FULL_34_15]|nr:MAG: hypothetical protein A2539_02615 [Elusimicrobia bacterium RIFOXYD2_FULL_34_15]
MEKIILDSEIRKQLTKGEMKKIRNSGKTPAVLYGEKENLNLLVDTSKFNSLLSKAGHNVIISLNFPDKTSKTVLVKEIQKNVISRKISHIDFYQISMEKKIEVAVPIFLIGEAPGVKAGGVLAHIVRELKVKCLPTDIPEKITINIANLEIGHSISVKDLTIPQNVEVLHQPDQIVVNIVSPTILEEIVPGATAETAAEPEVISKGKKEEEGEEGAEGKPGEAKKEAAAPAKKEAAVSAKKEEKK